MRRLLPLLLCLLACGLPAGAAADTASGSAITQPAVRPVHEGRVASATTLAGSTADPAGNGESPIPVALSSVAPVGRRLSSEQVLAIAERLPKMKSIRKQYPGSYGGAYLKPFPRWQVSFFSKGGKKEIGQVIINDTSGRVLEQWTGFQVAWTMARGYPGAFGRHVNALYVWLPLCLLFLVPFVNPRKLFSMLHLDLLVLLSLSVSLAYFNHAHIYASVPLAYPPLLYLLGRMLWLLRRPRAGAAETPPLRMLIPSRWLALGVIFLIGFRVALNVTDSNVIDVGYAGVIGATRIKEDRSLYGHFPADNEHGDTYGPASYEMYLPAVQVFGWSGLWDDLPAAHATSILFDLLAVGLLFLLGRRMRGPTLGIALAYAWVSYPFTLFALESNSNDTIVAVFVLLALLAASYRMTISTGVASALAGLTKVAPLALAPLLLIDGLRGAAVRSRPLLYLRFLAGFAVAGAIVMYPALEHNSLHEIYERTIVYQSERHSPFSVWGLYGWHGAEHVAEVLAVVLAIALALVPRRMDMVGLAAACGAILLGVELTLEHWFYLYVPWFLPAVFVVLLGRFGSAGLSSPLPDVASAAALSNRPAAALSS